MTTASVCPVSTGPSPGLEPALAGQTRAIDHPLAAEDGLARAVAGGLASGADWLWILGPGLIPDADALEALVGALRLSGGLPAPLLLTGIVKNAEGQIDATRAPWYRAAPTEPALEGITAGVLPIRACTAPVLVSRAAVLGSRGPRSGIGGPAALLDWTARMLRDEPVGYCVAGSVTRSASPAGTLGPRDGTALVCGHAFRGAERARVALDLAFGSGAYSARNGTGARG